MACRIKFTGKQLVELESFEPKDPTGDQVRVRSLYSLMSTGTENIVFNRLFEAGSHWDQWVKYPFYPGYAMVGEVEEIGPGVKNLKKGDKVALRNSHASCHVVGEGQCHRVPEGVDLKAATWFALAKIAFMGVKAARYLVGDSVLLIGAGPIGQMSTRWANALGLQSITVVDLVKSRLAFAKQGGATTVIDSPVTLDLKVPDSRVVIDCTGNAKVFTAALHLVKPRGTVVILGDTGTPTEQHLTSDVMMRGITIVAAHDGHEDETWNSRTILPYFFELVRSKAVRSDRADHARIHGQGICGCVPPGQRSPG